MDQLPEDSRTLKRIRANKKSCLTRICNRAENLITIRGSRTILQQLLADIDHALDAVVESNEAYLAVVGDGDESVKAVEYASEAEAQRNSVIQRITAHLQARSDEAPSEASVVSSHRSTASAARLPEALIEARLRALKLRQTERRLQREKEFDLKIRTAREEAEMVELEVKLREEDAELDGVNLDHTDNFEERSVATECGNESEPVSIDDPIRVRINGGSTDVADRAADGRASGTNPGRLRAANWIRDLSTRTGVSPENQRRLPRHAELHSVPRISLSKFAGDPLEWPKWIGLFRALIHEQEGLSDSEKMIHLQSAVTGLAQQTIQGMLYDGSLYTKALVALENRFGRREDIVIANLNAVFQSHPLKYADTAALQKFQARASTAQ